MLLTYFYFSRNNMTELLMLKSKYVVSELLWQLFLDIFMFIFSTLDICLEFSLFFWIMERTFLKKSLFGFTSR